jgi:trans-aconitate 2-methyltransferase
VTPRDWDAAAYDRLAAPQTRWGRGVVDRLVLGGDERVLDAGCGTGKVTAMLRERLPDGEIVALDASASMVALARRRLGHDRITYVLADLQEPLPIRPTVDAVLSTATFHWIPDHGRLFDNIASVMRPGAQLVAQCGGSGNLASVEAALRDMGESFEGRKHYASPQDTRAHLVAAGFTDAEAWLQEERTPLDRRDLEPYLTTIILGDHVHGMGDDERRRFVHEVAIRLPTATIDYVRLNITARRAA